MNCKPGDLAICTKDAPTDKTAGRLFDVLSAAPLVNFVLPNGMRHEPSSPNRWICKVVGEPLMCAGTVQQIKTDYVVIPDIYLVPVSGLPEVEDTTTDTPIKELA